MPLIILVVVLLVGPFAADAQPAGSHRVGVLVPQSWDERAFRQALTALGYHEDANLLLDVRSAEGRLDRLPSLASELVGARPHVIVAMNTPGTRAAMAATKTIPIVMGEVGDPVATGFVSNLARPEGNVTGVSNLCGELAAKRLSLLKEAVPTARRIAVMLNPNDPITAVQVKDAQRAAPSIGVEARLFPVRTIAELEAGLESMLAWRPDAALWLCGQQAVLEQHTVNLMSKHRLPVMPYRGEAVPAGGLMSYSPDRSEAMRRVASYVDRILKGAKPADLPVEQPTKIDLFVNLKTAKALGLTIPPSLLLRADQVIR